MKPFVFLLLLFSSWAHGCEPCLSKVSLRETIELAEMVALIEYEPSSENQSKMIEGLPSHIQLRVISVFKGNPQDKIIKAQHSDGTCNYGSLRRITPGEKIVFLTSRRDGVYFAVPECGYQALNVEQDKVLIDGNPMVLNQFVDEFLSAQPNE